MTLGTKVFIALALLSFYPAQSQATNRSLHTMTTGNGHHFSIFDRTSGRITEFLEHPYAFVAAANDGGTYGIHRRNLAHDLYFGIQTSQGNHWLTELEDIEYLEQTHVITGRQHVGSIETQTHYFAPFALSANALAMVLKVTNHSSSNQEVSVFAKPNLKLGEGRPYPNDWDESLKKRNAPLPHMRETGSGGGHAFYLPFDSTTQMTCGQDSPLYHGVLDDGWISQNSTCSGSSQVPLLHQSLSLAPGETKTWGLTVIFLNDNPAHPRAQSFRDSRSTDDIMSIWNSYSSGQTATSALENELASFENWRKPPPSGLSTKELKVWRQSEAVLRMGLIEEKPSNSGMLLASLPPGDWHVGWVRDGTYAAVSLAMTGHYEEAKKGINFFLGAEAGLYNRPEYYELQRPYRISVCRYFGDGQEESDWNVDGPNYETDGWGLVLWAARQYLESSCDLDWLDSTTRQGDTVYEALLHIGQDIRSLIIDDLPAPDNSIWEVHWDHRQIFGYTVATSIRGLADLAAIIALKGDLELSQEFQTLADNMRDKAREVLVHQPTQSIASHAGVASSYTHADGSTVEFLNWGIFEPDSSIYAGTLEQYDVIRTEFGGYRRLDPQLSLTGESAATVYDTREWVMMDLRIGDAWLKSNHSNGVAEYTNLFNTVTDLAAVNDNLIAELYDPINGNYEGAIPMVGYGAGAWMMSKLLKLGTDAAMVGTSLSHCLTDDSEPTGDEPEPELDCEIDEQEDAAGCESNAGGTNAGSDQNETTPSQPSDSGQSDNSGNTEPSSTVRETYAQGCSSTPGSIYFLLFIVGLLRRRD